AIVPGTRALLGLHGVEQGVELLEVGLPMLAVALEPRAGLGERLRDEAARSALGVAAARDQAGLLQHLEVARDGRLRHREPRGELHHRSLAAGEAREDRPARRIGESGEGGVEAIGSQHSITPSIYNFFIIYTC